MSWLLMDSLYECVDWERSSTEEPEFGVTYYGFILDLDSEAFFVIGHLEDAVVMLDSVHRFSEGLIRQRGDVINIRHKFHVIDDNLGSIRKPSMGGNNDAEPICFAFKQSVLSKKIRFFGKDSVSRKEPTYLKYLASFCNTNYELKTPPPFVAAILCFHNWFTSLSPLVFI